jgi:small subunit ribosomal protein S1
VVAAANKGGLEVTVSGVRAFCPLSQIDLRPVADPATLVGQRLSFRVLRIEGGGESGDEAGRRGPNVVVSRRALLEDEARARAAVTRTKLAVGAVLPGVVTGLRDFGAFVDLGGIEGLLHVSELGFGRVGKPSDVLAVGQNVEVQVIRIEKRPPPKDPKAKVDPDRTEQIALSLKSLAADPWDEVASRFPEGTRAQGTVTRVEAFGAFVELTPGIEGLVHVSALGAGRALRHAREAVKPGQSLEVTVTALDRERRRLSLAVAGAGDDRVDDSDPAATAAARAAAAGPARLGTLGDLLKRAASGERGAGRSREASPPPGDPGRRPKR